MQSQLNFFERSHDAACSKNHVGARGRRERGGSLRNPEGQPKLAITAAACQGALPRITVSAAQMGCLAEALEEAKMMWHMVRHTWGSFLLRIWGQWVCDIVLLVASRSLVAPKGTLFYSPPLVASQALSQCCVRAKGHWCYPCTQDSRLSCQSAGAFICPCMVSLALEVTDSWPVQKIVSASSTEAKWFV